MLENVVQETVLLGETASHPQGTQTFFGEYNVLYFLKETHLWLERNKQKQKLELECKIVEYSWWNATLFGENINVFRVNVQFLGGMQCF